MLGLDKNKLEKIKSVLVNLGEDEKLIWPWLSEAKGKPVDKRGANKYIFLCILDYKKKSDVTLANVERFTEKYLGDPEELWKEIFKRHPDFESWKAKKKDYNLHHLSQAHERIWKIGKLISEYYDGDIRKAWINKKSDEVFECFRNKLGIGEQLSRMAVGGLIATKQISGKGDVKADIHVRRVLGRIFYKNYEKDILSEEEAVDLARKIYPDNPWDLDGPLYLTGNYFCKAKEPDCDSCNITFLCDYFMHEKKGTTSVFWNNKGLSLYGQGEYEEAIKCFDKALKIEPEDFTTLTDKGLALYGQGKYGEAIKCFDKALKIEPDFILALYYKGLTLYEHGEYEEAIKYYNKALKIQPDFVPALYNKGVSLSEIGEYEEAIKCFDEALKIQPDFALALNSKGLALYVQKKYEEAIKCFDKVLELEPENADVWLARGEGLRALEKYKEAIKCYNKALQFAPTREDIKEAMKECKKIAKKEKQKK